jgi:hypothetical protein
VGEKDREAKKRLTKYEMKEREKREMRKGERERERSQIWPK